MKNTGKKSAISDSEQLNNFVSRQFFETQTSLETAFPFANSLSHLGKRIAEPFLDIGFFPRNVRTGRLTSLRKNNTRIPLHHAYRTFVQHLAPIFRMFDSRYGTNWLAGIHRIYAEHFIRALLEPGPGKALAY